MITLRDIASRFAVPNWRWYLSGTVALAITTWITVSIPRLSKDLINEFQVVDQVDELQSLALMIVALGLMQVLIRALSRILFFWPGRKLEFDVKNHFFGRLIRFPMTFYGSKALGDLISRIANDVTHLRIFFAFAVLQTVNFVFLLVFAIAQMYQVHPTLTSIAILPLACMLITTRVGMPFLHRYSLESQESVASLTNDVTEAFVHVGAIQSASAAPSFERQIHQKNQALYRANIRLSLVRNLIFPLSTFLTGCSYLIVLFVGGQLIISGTLSVGDILAFNMYIALLSFPLTALGIIMSVYQRAQAAAERLAELEEEPLEQSAKESRLDWQAERVVELIDVDFSYPDSDQPALQSIDLSIGKNEKVGVVGPIGAGKTSLIRLIGGHYKPTSGKVRIANQDLSSINLEQLRTGVGYAQQSPYLFSASIKDNIGFGRDAADSEIHAAAQDAAFKKDIVDLSYGWETQVGEGGVRLSGGQKQRLALARVFLQRPKLWLLDDTVSALDEMTEKEIMGRLHAIDATMIIISHRPQTLRRCDRVIAMHQGRIIDDDSFEAVKQRHPEFFATAIDA